ncbi:unnamed protein product, partial [Phaeothamnion confervicola]
RNFNYALKAFVQCIGDLGQFVSQHDPTLALPYVIKDDKVNGLPATVGSIPEEWTKAIKFLLTDLKWLVAWAAKY